MTLWRDKNGYERHGNDKYVHRTKVEKLLGRKLTTKECVHHLDFNKENNGNTNLVVCPNQEYHFLLHARQRILNLGGHPDTHAYCDYHKSLHLKEKFSTAPSHWNGLGNRCKDATNEYRKINLLNRDKFDWKARMNQQYRRASKKGLVSCLSKEGRCL